MLLLLPLDGDDTQESKLVSLNDVKKWALMEIESGEVVEINFYDSRDAIDAWIDAVVVISDSEYVWPFQEENMGVLVAHTQRTIDDIVEAYLFKELHELNY